MLIDANKAAALSQYNNSGADQQELRRKYPAWQVDKYRGIDGNFKPTLCLAEESWTIIPEESREHFQFEAEKVYYGESPTQIYKVGQDIDLTFIPLALPKVFVKNKLTKTYRNLAKFQEGDRSETKLFLVPLIHGDLPGNKVIVTTLKLRSFATDSIIGRSVTQKNTLTWLSHELRQAGLGVQGKSNLHFASIKISAFSEYRKAKSDPTKSNWGIGFRMEFNELNKPEVMAQIQSIFTPELLADIADPFGLGLSRISQPQQSIINQNPPSQQTHREILEEIKTLRDSQGWANEFIVRNIREQFGVESSAQLSIEQMLQLRDYLLGKASLNYDYGDETF